MHIHKHISRKVMEANQKNSHHSHGPTTARGRDAIRHNALTHGLLARALVFKNEKEEQILYPMADQCLRADELVSAIQAYQGR